MAKRIRRNKNLVINDMTRLFIGENARNCCGRRFEFHSCIGIDGLNNSKGAKTKVYCPSPNKYGEFDVVAEYRGADTDGTASLSTNYDLDNSKLEKLFNNDCDMSLRINIGKCGNPADINEFEKAIILEGVSVNSYNIANLYAKAASERNVVTETAEITYTSMTTITKPEMKLVEQTLIGDGPLLDSWVFCDETCCLCEGAPGFYAWQLVDCGTGCAKMRVIYSADGGDTWRVVSIPACDGIECDIDISRPLVYELGNGYHNIGLDGTFYTSIRSEIVNSLATIPETALLVGTVLYTAESCGNYVIFAGQSGQIFLFDKLSETYDAITHNSIPITEDYKAAAFNQYCDVFAIGDSMGRTYTYDIETNEVTVLAHQTIAPVHHIEFVNDCTVITAIDDVTYISDNGTISETNLLGYLTAIEFANEYIGYAVTANDTDTNILWMTSDGGFTWVAIDTELEGTAVFNNIAVCDNQPGDIAVTGFVPVTPITAAQKVETGILWNCEGAGIVYSTQNLLENAVLV